MEPNPYETPTNRFDDRRTRLPVSVPSQRWFWIALIALAIGGVIANQAVVGIVKLLRPMSHSSLP
jgi:hypothetical protein